MPIFDPERPFNDLPPLPPAADIETRAILKGCIGARSALAELKAVGALIPNQDVLINTLPLREAKDSSAIENVVTTDDRLFHHAAMREHDADPATKETLRYRTALYEGYRGLRRRPLSTATAVEICRTLRETDVDIRTVPGTALRNDSTGQAVYTPPVGEALLRDRLANWERFLHDATDIDPLIRMAVSHYQFEAIHPFTDGNGRTGRILNILFLIEQGLLEIPVLYLSRHVIKNKDAYYRLLLEVTTQQRWEAWILFMLDAVARTAKWTTAKVLAIRELMADTGEYIAAMEPKIHSHELVELIFTQPYCRIAHVVEAGIAKRATAAKYLKALSGIGVLRETATGRDKLFVHPRFMALLLDEENTFVPYGAAAAPRP